MTESNGGKTGEGSAPGKAPRRARGTGFPSMPLSDAVILIKKVASYGNTHTNAAVASFLGHQTPNSGPYRTKVAALKDYGLLAGRGDELTVTALGSEITHPGLDADPKASLARAFRSCKLFAAVYDELPTDRDLEVSALANSALHNHGVAAQAKDAFARSFVKSGESAGLLVSVADGRIRLDEPIGDTPDASEVEVESPQVRAPAGRENPVRPVSSTAVVNHSWPIEGGTIRFVVESSRPLPASAYGVIGTVIEAGDKLAGMLGLVEVAPENVGDSE